MKPTIRFPSWLKLSILRRAFARTSESVKPEHSSWLWTGWLRDNALGVLAGDPGAGKTTLALEIAARVSRGAALPGDAISRRPGNVLYLSFEDNLADLRLRSDAAGADPARLLFMNARDVGKTFLRMDDLARIVRDYDVRLVVVDTLPAALDRGYSPGSASVTKALQLLRQFALENHTTILLIRHFTKNFRGGPASGAAGNVAILGTVGHEIHVEPDSNDRRLFQVDCVKSVDSRPASLTYTIVGGQGGSRVEWVE